MTTAVTDAIKAYGNIPAPTPKPDAGAQDWPSFLDALDGAMRGAADTVKAGEQAATAGLMGKAPTQEVVEALAQAELTLQTASAIRDRVVEAYQDILRMQV